MGKLTTYILMMSGLTLLFYFTGLTDNTINSTLLTLLLNPSNLSTSALGTQISLVLIGIATAGIVIGFFSQNSELILIAPFTIWLLGVLWDFLSVANKVYSVNPVIAILFFSPLLLLFGVTIVEFWRGRD